MSQKKNLNIEHTFWQILHNQCYHTRSKGKAIMVLMSKILVSSIAIVGTLISLETHRESNVKINDYCMKF